MIKRLVSILTLITFFNNISGQIILPKTEFKKLVDSVEKNETKRFATTLLSAQQKKWPVSFTTSNGVVASLISVDAFGYPQYYFDADNNIAATTTGANQLWPGASLGCNVNGSSINMQNKLAMWEGGYAKPTHIEINNRITLRDSTAVITSHATHTTGTMIATGINLAAKGMAYKTNNIIAYDFNNSLTEILKESPNLLLSNHSYIQLAGWNFANNRWEFYGRPDDNEDYKFGYYSNDTQMWDSILYNAPYYLIVNAAGNYRTNNGPPIGTPYYRYDSTTKQMQYAGLRPNNISSNNSYGSIATIGNAKNILTIGAVNGLPNGYLKKEDVLMTNFSSWGPTDDGRIKPDLVADGVNVLSSVSDSDTSYALNSGTSMSTANATGSLFLLQEYYAQLHANNFMKAATLKALAIHTADEAGIAAGPDYQFGWGLLNVAKAATLITNAQKGDAIIYENILNNKDSFSVKVIAKGTTPLKVTIVWTDPKGVVENINVLNNTTPKLVNDLDLKITTEESAFLPWVLNPATPNVPATHGNNVIDNVEQVVIDTPTENKTYTIKISHKNNLERGSQAYSLIVSGIENRDENGFDISVFPVPSTGVLNTKIFVPISSNIEINIINTIGLTCFKTAYQHYSGMFQQSFNLQNLANGLYVITVRCGDRLVSKKFIINK